MPSIRKQRGGKKIQKVISVGGSPALAKMAMLGAATNSKKGSKR